MRDESWFGIKPREITWGLESALAGYFESCFVLRKLRYNLAFTWHKVYFHRLKLNAPVSHGLKRFMFCGIKNENIEIVTIN